MKQLNEQEIKYFYENADNVWQKDKWYNNSRILINRFIKNTPLKANDYVLNAGSGGSTYNLENNMLHLDIASNKIDFFPNYLVGSIEKTPFNDNSFDVVICVGSVLNYVDAVQTLSEISRLLKSGGKFILEFESSWGFEHLWTKSYKKSASIAALYYQGRKRNQWLYSPYYIENLLDNYGFDIVLKSSFHIISSLSYKILKNEDKAAKFDKFDSFFTKIPYFDNRSSNKIYYCTLK